MSSTFDDQRFKSTASLDQHSEWCLSMTRWEVPHVTYDLRTAWHPCPEHCAEHFLCWPLGEGGGDRTWSVR